MVGTELNQASSPQGKFEFRSHLRGGAGEVLEGDGPSGKERSQA